MVLSSNPRSRARFRHSPKCAARLLHLPTRASTPPSASSVAEQSETAHTAAMGRPSSGVDESSVDRAGAETVWVKGGGG